MPQLTLASTSRYRKALLEKLGLPFDCVAPEIDEDRRPGETPAALVQRLAEAKARAVAAQGRSGLIIGSDQVAVGAGVLLGKPGSVERAIEQLRSLSGREVVFHTGLCLLNTLTDQCQVLDETYKVRFRALDEARIRRYVERDRPLDCAGAFKSEGLGIVLFESLHGRDPNSLIGLPLIALTELLEAEGIPLPPA